MATLEQLEAGVKKAYESGNLDYARILGAQLVEARKDKSNQIPGMQVAGTGGKQTAEPGIVDKAITVGKHALGAAEAAIALGTGATTGALGYGAGTLSGIISSVQNGTYGTQEGVKMAEEAAQAGAEQFTRTPKTPEGKEYTELAGNAMANLIPLAGLAPEVSALTQAAKPGIAQAVQTVKQGGAKAAETVAQSRPVQAVRSAVAGESAIAEGMPTGEAQFGSVGAAGANPAEIARAKVANSSPELIAEVERRIKKGEEINQKALDNQIEAESLDHPVYLTAGRASEDPINISHEMNTRGKNPEYIERTDANNQALIDNLNTIRERQAPDVFLQDKFEHGEALINLYDNLENNLKKDISEKYKALRDANGGDFPLDTSSFAANVEAALKKQNLSEWLDPKIKNLINTYRDAGSMTFDQFETFRTILANEARTETNGNARYAAGLVRNFLEDIPLTTETESLKALADAARTAARNRFSMIEADPAYKAFVNGKTSVDSFINKFIINSPSEKVQAMLKNLGIVDTEQSRQIIASALGHYLKSAAKVSNDTGTFAASTFNTTLEKLRPKVALVFGEDAKKLDSVGNVARNEKRQPAGNFVNNSQSATALIADEATSRIPGIRQGKEFVKRVKERKDVERSLRVGAGISAKESKLLEVRRKVEAKKAEKAAKQNRK